MNSAKIAVILALAIGLSACNKEVPKTIPQRLIGTWITPAPKYAGRFFELKNDSVIFGMGEGKVTNGAVQDVSESQEQGKTLYNVSYKTIDGSIQKFAFYFDTSRNLIQLKSQDKVEWFHGTPGVAMASAATGAPSGATGSTGQKSQTQPPSEQGKMLASAIMPRAADIIPVEDYKGPKRDPFIGAIKKASPTAEKIVLPPGKRGILISQAILQGVAKSPDGMIAVVSASNGGIYFLRPNDAVYNGRVAKITIDSIVFEESVSDALGQSSMREVVRKLHGTN